MFTGTFMPFPSTNIVKSYQVIGGGFGFSLWADSFESQTITWMHTVNMLGFIDWRGFSLSMRTPCRWQMPTSLSEVIPRGWRRFGRTDQILRLIRFTSIYSIKQSTLYSKCLYDYTDPFSICLVKI